MIEDDGVCSATAFDATSSCFYAVSLRTERQQQQGSQPVHRFLTHLLWRTSCARPVEQSRGRQQTHAPSIIDDRVCGMRRSGLSPSANRSAAPSGFWRLLLLLLLLLGGSLRWRDFLATAATLAACCPVVAHSAFVGAVQQHGAVCLSHLSVLNQWMHARAWLRGQSEVENSRWDAYIPEAMHSHVVTMHVLCRPALLPVLRRARSGSRSIAGALCSLRAGQLRLQPLLVQPVLQQTACSLPTA